MTAIRWALPPLRVLLVLTFCAALVGEVFSMPGQFRHMAAESPELGPVPWVLLALAILELVALQIVIVCTWRLVDMVKVDRIFSSSSFSWVNVMVGTIAGAWLLFVAVSAFLVGVIYFTPELRDPGTPALLLAMDLVGGVVVLVVVVMRALLRQATVLRTDLEAVI